MGVKGNVSNVLLKELYTNYTKNPKNKWKKSFIPRGICYESIRQT